MRIEDLRPHELKFLAAHQFEHVLPENNVFIKPIPVAVFGRDNSLILIFPTLIEYRNYLQSMYWQQFPRDAYKYAFDVITSNLYS